MPAQDLKFEDNVSYYDQLVGPGGKFYDPDPIAAREKLARGKMHSDHFVPILEKRLDQFRDDNEGLNKQLLAGQRLQELVDKMSNTQTTNSNSNQPPANDTGMPASLDMTQVTSQMQKLIMEERIAQEQERNVSSVVTKLKERYGDNYLSSLDKQYKELGLSPEVATQIAKTTPRALERMLGLDQPVPKQTFQTPPQNTRRADHLPASNQTAKSWSEWQQVKQKDPKFYYSKQAAAQMEQDYATLREDFETGDFHS